jgi:polyhydroxyalkanoate synthase
LWETLLTSWGGTTKPPGATTAPKPDKRFADPAYQENPYFALVLQTYQLFSDQITAMAEGVEGLDPPRKEQVRFFARTITEALSPDHFPLTNPQVIAKALETNGESLIKGMDHLLADLRRGQLTHTDPAAFRLGENIATTPGKVIHRTPLYELLHYTPTTEKVGTIPLLIFPPWINRFYILDLNPQKSFVQWALDQGLSVFLVSWKSAQADDPALDWGAVTWDDYIAAQMEAIEVVRARLKVPAVHTIGYCVAGTTLAATLAILARRGEADKVASATFFTAQVDFEKAGELKAFIDDQQLATLETLGGDGVMDGRYLAATFNLLRSQDLIWNYVTRNYLLGEDYTAFDLLHWNGDTTNLPARWHQDYLRDLYRDNRLVQPDSLSACGTPIDLSRITTPSYIQAGREDHIAPLESVWRLARALHHAPQTFLLAGSGHIAGVVNPPAAKKYQYWTCERPTDSLETFLECAKETPGSWWPHWRAWLRDLDPSETPARGKRIPGGRGDSTLGDAPGEYVRQR